MLSEVWKKHWTKHDDDRRADQLAAAFRQARSEALHFLATQVAGALRAMRPERACCLDHWIPSNWLNLPIGARDGIASILTKCEKGLVWPHQVMQSAVALLGKSVTDDRPISLSCLQSAVYF